LCRQFGIDQASQVQRIFIQDLVQRNPIDQGETLLIAQRRGQRLGDLLAQVGIAGRIGLEIQDGNGQSGRPGLVFFSRRGRRACLGKQRGRGTGIQQQEEEKRQ